MSGYIYILRIFLLVSFHSIIQIGTSNVFAEDLKDTSRINKLLNDAYEIIFANPDSSLLLAKEALDLSSSLNLPEFVAKCNNSIGYSYTIKGEHSASLAYFNEAMGIYEDLNDLESIHSLYIRLGVAYLYFSRYDLANNYFFKALKYFEDKSDDLKAASIYLNLTFSSYEYGDYEKAREFSNNALILSEKLGAYNISVRALMNLGEVSKFQMNYPLALTYFNQSLNLADSLNDLQIKSYILNNIGEVYIILNKLDSARLFLTSVFEATQTWEDKFISALAFQNIAETYAMEGRYKEAINYAWKAYDLAVTEQMMEVKADVYNKLSSYFEGIQEYKMSLHYKQQATIIRDSIFTVEKSKQLSEIEAIYQNEKKQNQILSLQNENEIQSLKVERNRLYLVLIITFSLILLMTALFFLYKNQLKTRHRTLELEQKLLRVQINPHFIFNAVSSIQNYIVGNKALEASSYLSNFAKLMRMILMNSRKELITIAEEIETLENYLKLQQLRFVEKLTYKIVSSDDVEEEEMLIPPMISQPFIENSIEHGIKPKNTNDGRVDVYFVLKDKKLQVLIEDNGIGRNIKDTSMKQDHISLGTSITESRLSLLGRKYHKESNVEIFDLQDNDGKASGTKVVLTLPIKYL